MSIRVGGGVTAQTLMTLSTWVGPILIALIASSGAWLTWLVTRKSADRKALEEKQRMSDRKDKRIIRLTNYAQRLRTRIESDGPPPAEPWPDDLFDEE
jgi:hypothetical protein